MHRIVKSPSLQTDDRSKYLGYNNERKEFVMDVKLKKEYSKGYIANAEGGYGTHDRYTGRLFGLRYTPHSRFTLFGNFNNLNQENSPGSDGEWNPRSLYNGVSSMKTSWDVLFFRKQRRNC
jgi:hypothetical protein